MTLIILMSVGQVFAEASKIGIVRADVLLSTAPQYRETSIQLSSEFKPKKEAIEKMEQNLVGLATRLEKNALTMSNEQKVVTEKEILHKRRELKRLREDFEVEFKIRNAEELKKLQNVINQGIAIVGKKEGYDLIFYDGIAYASERVDLTEAVLEVLRVKHNEAKK